MFSILNAWGSSLTILNPRNLVSLCHAAWQIFTHGCKRIVTSFWILLTINMILNIVIVKYITPEFIKHYYLFGDLLPVINEIIQGFITIAFIFLMRPNSGDIATVKNFISYLSYSVCTTVILLVILSPLLFIDYYARCTLAYYYTPLFGIIFLVALFYWLDSDVFPSEELLVPLKYSGKLILYSLPLFVIFFAMYFVGAMFIGTLISNLESYMKSYTLMEPIINLLLIYFKWLFSLLGISIAYAYYYQKKETIN